jgi:ABC-type glutathione transport system ATPase component
MADVLLRAQAISVWYPVQAGILFPRTIDHIRAVTDVSFDLHAGEILGIVGESGSGKRSLLRAAMLLEVPTAGRLLFRGTDLFQSSHRERVAYQRSVQAIFQHPRRSLDPALHNSTSASEPIIASHGLRSRLDTVVEQAFLQVGLDLTSAERLPASLSGGQQQRVALARATTTHPQILFADECVSALDVSVQARIISLLRRLRDDLGLAIVFVSHDLAVVRQLCDSVLVLQQGSAVEYASATRFFESPRSSYSRQLLSAATNLGLEP